MEPIVAIPDDLLRHIHKSQGQREECQRHQGESHRFWRVLGMFGMATARLAQEGERNLPGSVKRGQESGEGQ